MIDRERACAPAAVPAGLVDAVQGYAWARDCVGESGCAIYRLHGKADAPDLFLKHGQGAFADDVTDEMVRLRWLSGHIAVPAIAHFELSANQAWLLTTALRGETAYQILVVDPATRPAIVDALARYLRRLHAVPIDRCPFTSDHTHRLPLARARIDAGLVDIDDFDDDRTGWTAEQVWDAAQALLPLSPDPVVTHGDFSLDNILIEDGEVSGCIDVAHAGIADRYQDLAILWNCLGDFDPSLQRRLFERYGLSEPDARKLDFHLLLDELF